MISKKLSKYIAAFDYADQIFIILSATFGTLSVVSHATVAENTKVFTTNPFFFFIYITNKLSLQLEALSNCDNFTVITIIIMMY